MLGVIYTAGAGNVAVDLTEPVAWAEHVPPVHTLHRVLFRWPRPLCLPDVDERPAHNVFTHFRQFGIISNILRYVYGRVHM